MGLNGAQMHAPAKHRVLLGLFSAIIFFLQSTLVFPHNSIPLNSSLNTDISLFYFISAYLVC